MELTDDDTNGQPELRLKQLGVLPELHKLGPLGSEASPVPVLTTLPAHHPKA